MSNVNSSEHIEHLIEAYLADGLSHEERISFESHCAGCQACAEALEQAREFEEKVFQSLAPDKAPADLEDSLIKAFRAKAPKPKSRRVFRPFGYLFHARLLRWASVPLAALILIVIGNMVMTPEMQGKISQSTPASSVVSSDTGGIVSVDRLTPATYYITMQSDGNTSDTFIVKSIGSVGNWTENYYGASDPDIMVKKGRESDRVYYSDELGVPAGGESWVAGDAAKPIEWKSTGAIGNIKLEYSTDGGVPQVSASNIHGKFYLDTDQDPVWKNAEVSAHTETADEESWGIVHSETRFSGINKPQAARVSEGGSYVVDNMIQRSDDGGDWWEHDIDVDRKAYATVQGETRGVELEVGKEVSAGIDLGKVNWETANIDDYAFTGFTDNESKSSSEIRFVGGTESIEKLAEEVIEENTEVSIPEQMENLREAMTSLMQTGIPEPADVVSEGGVAVGNPIARMPILLATNALNPQQKIIKSGTLTFEVESFDKAYQQVVKIVTEAKGYIASSSATKLPNGKVRGQIVIRVLPELFDVVTLRLRVLGELKNQSVTAEDITKKYFDLQARLKNARAMEERLIKLMAEKTGEVKDLLLVEKELDKTREKIERFQGELKYYDNLSALATIRLEINEKDIEKPFEYVQTQSANLSLAVADVVTAYHQAQAMVYALDGQIVEARLTDQNNRIKGIVKAYVDAEYFSGLLEEMKGLGEVKSAVAEQRRTSSSGKASADKDTKVRKERGLVNLTLNPPAGEYIQTKRARIILKSADVNKAYAQAQEMAAQVKAKILNGKLNRETDRVIGQLFCQVEPEDFRPLINSLRAIAEVKSCSVEEHQTARGIDPKSMLQAPIRKEPGRIELVIISPAPIMPKEGGISATLKKTLKGSFGGLLWSLERLVVGVATIGPWLAILILVIILTRRYFRRSSKKGEVK